MPATTNRRWRVDQVDSSMDLELLQSISLAVSQVRTVETVLKMIVDGLVEGAGLALARIWLIGPGDICATCPMGHECPSRMRCLHLAASAGRSQVDGQEWRALRARSDASQSAYGRSAKSALLEIHSLLKTLSWFPR